MTRVLIFGDDMRICLTLVRAFGRAGKEVHIVPLDRKSPVLRSRYITKVHILPDHRLDFEGWRREVGALVSHTAFDLIVPCVDTVQIAMDLNRDLFTGLNLALPDRRNWKTLFDKEHTHRVAGALGIPMASCALLKQSDTPDSLIHTYGLPIVIKPQQSNRADRLAADEKVFIATDRTQLETYMLQLSDRSGYLVEAYFQGSGVGVSVLADKGNIVLAFQHRRLREGWGGSSSYRISETVDEGLLEACGKLMRHTEHHGVCMFEFRKNLETGAWILLETNARFWGSMPLPIALGVDFPNQLHALMTGKPTIPPVTYRAGVRSRNTVLDGFNILRSLSHGRPFGNFLADVAVFVLQPVWWLIGREKNDSFVADDLLPGMIELVRLPRDMLRKVAIKPGAGGRTSVEQP